MWIFPAGLKVYLALGFTDMRKSVNGLSIQVSEIYEKDPYSGHLFVFCNRRKKILKILYWDRNGFAVWYKKLEKHRFRWPEKEEDLIEICQRELQWLLEGLDVHQQEAHESLSYEIAY